MGVILLVLLLPWFPPCVHLLQLPHEESVFDLLEKEQGTKQNTKADVVVHYNDDLISFFSN